MRERKDTAHRRSIENLDPWACTRGFDHGCPAQTLSDKEYQIMRDASIACLREIGVDTGGSNVQFAINPKRRPHAEIEMIRACRVLPHLRPRRRVFPSQVAAKLAVATPSTSCATTSPVA